VDRNFYEVQVPLELNVAKESLMGRGILLWLLGVPIPIIILILLFWR
jgi:hypothetical protein